MNKLLFLLLCTSILMVACKSHKPTTEYQEYKQPKRINHKKTVVIPEVDADEIIRKAP